MAETYIYGAYDTKSYANHWRARIGYEYTQNATNKTSTVTLKLYVYNGYTSYNSTSNSAYYKFMDNTTHYKTYNFSTAKTWNLIATTTKTVTHDSRGKASLAVNGTWCSGMSSAAYTPYTLTVSGTITFKDIPVASTVSATNANIGSASTITINAFSSSFKHTLSYKINDGAYTQIATNVGSSYSWTLPNSLNNVLSAAATTLGITIKCETFNGSTSLGTTTCSLTGYAVEADLKPVLSATIVDTNASTIALTGDSSKLIKYYSNAQVTTTATAYGTASITSYKIVNGSKSITSATETINAVESNKFTISATDTRGFTTTISLEPVMVDYVKPTCSLEVTETNASTGEVKFNINGLVYSGNFGATSNVRKVEIRTKEINGSWGSWETCSPTTYSSGTYSYEGTKTLIYTKNYQIQARITDKVNTSGAYSSTKDIVFKPLFYWNEDEFIFNIHTKHYKQKIETSEDLDNFTESGLYYINSGADAEAIGNTPCKYGGVLEVMKLGEESTTYVKQVYYPRVSDSRHYERYKGSSSWYSWKAFEPIEKDSIFYKDGETITLRYYGAGYIISNKEVYFLIPFSKLKGEINSASIVSGASNFKMQLWQNGKNVLGSSYVDVNTSSYNHSITVLDNGLYVTFRKNTDISGISNGTPIGIAAQIKVTLSSAASTASLEDEELIIVDEDEAEEGEET